MLIATLALLCVGAGPADAVLAAAADVQRHPPEVRPYLRYLSLYHVEGKALTDWQTVVDFHANALSVEAKLTPAARVNPSLLRVNLLDYGWSAKVWEKLLQVEPYFHAAVEVEKVIETQGYHPGGEVNGTYYAPGNYTFREKKKVKAVAAAPWLPAKEVALLAAECQTQIPIVRGDWFFSQTSIAKDRVAGYYDFLGLGKSAKDFQKLIGADEEIAKKVKREVRAIQAKSGVTLNNRVLVRYGAVSGPWWVSYDYKDNAGRRNVIRNLDKDVDPQDGDASEQHGTLPNGLYVWWLQDAAGVRQDTAPDFIASDGRSNDNDRRVHCAMSCYRCHVEGIRPIDDYARRLYRGAVRLAVADYKQYVRLAQLYLTDLQKWVVRDREDYAQAVWEITQRKPAELSRVYGWAWDHYLNRDLDAKAVAVELGCTEERLLKALRTFATPGKGIPPLDPVLAQLIAEEPIPLRREHFDEAFILFQRVLMGYKP